MQEIQINQDIELKILTFIQNQFAMAQHCNLSSHDLLLETGLIDSMGFIELLQFTESEFNITIEGEELLPENFQTVGALAKLVESKLLNE
jgi:acyl carrier protein